MSILCEKISLLNNETWSHVRGNKISISITALAIDTLIANVVVVSIELLNIQEIKKNVWASVGSTTKWLFAQPSM